jgi:Phage Mu protein F like protein
MEDLAAPDLELAITRLGTTLLDPQAAKAAFPNQQWPGWYSDTQIAYEYAHQMASQLAASVNAGQIAQGWLSQKGLVPRHRRGVPPRKRKKRRRRSSNGAPPQQSQPPAQQQTTARPAPRQYLNGLGVTGALLGVLVAILGALWAAAFALGWASAIAVLGVGDVEGAEAALEELILAGQQRLGWILQTRMSRIQRVLVQALREGWDADRLAQAIADILGSLSSALLVAISETTWASGAAAFAVYQAAGVKWVRWQTRNDSLVCARCMANQKASPILLGMTFPSGDKHPLAHPRCRCSLLPAQAPALPPGGSPA